MDRKINDLDDVDEILKEKPRNRVITRQSNGARQRASYQRRQRELRLEQGILTMPILIIVLICLVLILEPFFGVKEEGDVKETTAVAMETTSENIAETVLESEEVKNVEALNDTELEAFFTEYFDARLNADVDRLNEMSGLTNQTEEQNQQLRSQLKTQAGYIERYQDLTLYGVEGLNEDELLVFLSYNVKFRRAETLAPGIMYCYLTKTEEGYQLIENRSPEQVKFINSYTSENAEVQELINSVNSQLLEALSSDSRLAVLYDAFQTGRIYTEDQADIDSEVSLISVETEAESTEASSAVRVEETTAESRRTETTAAQTQNASTEVQTTPQVVEAQDPGQAGPAGDDSPVQESPADANVPEAPAGDVIEAAENPGN